MTTYRLPEPEVRFVRGPVTWLIKENPQLYALLSVLNRTVMDEFAQDPFMRGIFEDGMVWAAGGAVRDAANKEVPKDIDLWFQSERHLVFVRKFIRDHYDFKVLGSSDMVLKLAVCLDTTTTQEFTNIDLVKRFISSPMETARRMDFICCSAAVSHNTYIRHEMFEQDSKQKILRVNAPWRPKSSLARMQRFLDRGWSIPPEERQKLQALADDPHLPDYDFAFVDGKPSSGWQYE